MALPEVTRDELERVHRALRITIPLDDVSPLMLHTLSHIAHAWATKGIPQNLYPTLPRREGTAALRKHARTKTTDIDLKRRAAGDND